MGVVDELALRGLDRLWAGTRTRLRVWNLKECFVDQLNTESREMGGKVPPDEVRLEIENVGDETSLTPTVVLTGYLPKPRGGRRRRATLGTRRRFNFRVQEADRRLPPHSPVRLTAVLPTDDIWGAELPHGQDDVLGFLWFKTYTFTQTRGRPLRYRVRSADGVRLSWVRFWLERLSFRLRGTVEVPPQGTRRT